MNIFDADSACLHVYAVLFGKTLSEGLNNDEIKTIIYFLSLVEEYLSSLLTKCK